jgi:GT2 family glycosyltransferase
MDSRTHSKRTLAIIVTHNSERYLKKCVHCLRNQDCEIALIDSGSKSTHYIEKIIDPNILYFRANENLGFCKANNIGFNRFYNDHDFILLINPDVFVHQFQIKRFVELMVENPMLGAISCPLIKYDIENEISLGIVDSFGIERNIFGRWYDLLQGKPVRNIEGKKDLTYPKALCGALYFCRYEAIKDTLIKKTQLLDERLIMYKDDIDLSLRLRRAGWQIALDPKFNSYHCRGWSSNRRKMPAWTRRQSAKNDILLDIKYTWWYLPISIAKYIFVTYIETWMENWRWSV